MGLNGHLSTVPQIQIYSHLKYTKYVDVLLSDGYNYIMSIKFEWFPVENKQNIPISIIFLYKL